MCFLIGWLALPIIAVGFVLLMGFSMSSFFFTMYILEKLKLKPREITVKGRGIKKDVSVLVQSIHRYWREN